MKPIIIIILTAFVSLQISTAKNKKLKPDETAKEVFTSAELKGIVKMIHYVDEIIIEKTNIKDINQAYHAYFEQLRPYIEKGEMYPALEKDTVKFKFLESLDKEAFDAVWKMSNSVRRIKYKDIDLKNLDGFKTLKLNIDGSFMDYLARIGESDKKYKDTNKVIEISGDIGASHVIYFPANHSEYDFTTFKDRLWATVILLRMGDPLEEKVERYLRNKKANPENK
jgi:hypothetical protein